MTRWPAIFVVLLGGGLGLLSAGELSLWEQLALAREDNARASQIEILRRLVDAGGGGDEVKGDLVRLWLDSGDYSMAESTLETMQAPPAEWQAVARAGRAFHHDQKPGEAVRVLEDYLEENPDALMATRSLAGMLARLGRTGEIIDFLDASPLTAGDSALMVARAEAKRQAGDLSGAMGDWGAARVLGEDHPEVRVKAAAFDRLARALEPLQKARSAWSARPEDIAAGVATLFWMREAGLPMESESASLVAQFPDAASARLMAALGANLSPWETQEKFAVRTSPPPDEAVLASLVKLDEAVAKGRAGSRIARARFLNQSMRQYELALHDVRTVLSEYPANSEALAEEVHALTQTGNTGEALSAYRLLMDGNPPRSSAAVATGHLAQMFFDAGNLAEALELANRSLGMEEVPSTLRLRAAIFQRLGRHDEASRDIAAAEGEDS
jgi:tetratricopeptide (TPR) repeat protein